MQAGRSHRSERLAKISEPRVASGPNGSTSDWICCQLCIKKRDAIWWRRATCILP
jgi:hypothetical protein